LVEPGKYIAANADVFFAGFDWIKGAFTTLNVHILAVRSKESVFA
jgi:hypothetical protein